MKKCPQCATENTELAKFCKECGYPIGVDDGFEDEDTSPDLNLKGFESDTSPGFSLDPQSENGTDESLTRMLEQVKLTDDSDHDIDDGQSSSLELEDSSFVESLLGTSNDGPSEIDTLIEESIGENTSVELLPEDLGDDTFGATTTQGRSSRYISHEMKQESISVVIPIGTKKPPTVESNADTQPPIESFSEPMFPMDSGSDFHSSFMSNPTPAEKSEDSDPFGHSILADTPEGSSGPMVVMKKGLEEGEPVARLVILEPTRKESAVIHLHRGTITCGSQGTDILLKDPFVSPLHCRFEVASKDKILLEDAGSQNGTFLRVQDRAKMTSGDRFRIGRQLLQFYSLKDFETFEDVSQNESARFWGSSDKGLWGRIVRIYENDLEGEAILLTKSSLQFGREVGDLTFPYDGYVSGSHARVELQNGDFYLRDLGSSNGTFISIRRPVRLQSGELMLVGQKLIRIEVF